MLWLNEFWGIRNLIAIIKHASTKPAMHTALNTVREQLRNMIQTQGFKVYTNSSISGEDAAA